MGLKNRKSLHFRGSQGSQRGLSLDFARRRWAGNAGLRPPYAPQAVFAKIQNWHFFMGKILGFMHFCHISTLTLARRAKSNKISSFSPYLAILQSWRGGNNFFANIQIWYLFIADLFHFMVFSIWSILPTTWLLKISFFSIWGALTRNSAWSKVIGVP